jgi:hypothetical protein
MSIVNLPIEISVEVNCALVINHFWRSRLNSREINVILSEDI